MFPRRVYVMCTCHPCTAGTIAILVFWACYPHYATRGLLCNRALQIQMLDKAVGLAIMRATTCLASDPARHRLGGLGGAVAHSLKVPLAINDNELRWQSLQTIRPGLRSEKTMS